MKNPLRTQENKEAAKFLIERIKEEKDRLWEECKTREQHNRMLYLGQLIEQLQYEFETL